jgi:RecB family endonuclease NucS
MLHPEALIKLPEGWRFSNESDLEDFVWNNLSKLFGLTPLKRQYIIQNDCCDILALSESEQLVIIELKNIEDRYVVQQLTRYYHSIVTEKPLADIVKYERPIRLIAIAPNFHRHNHIDQLYNKLSVEFFQFEITQLEKQLTLHIKNQEEQNAISEIIPYPQAFILDEETSVPKLRILPRIPKAFEKLLDERHAEEKEIALKIREQILSYDEKMAETSTQSVIRYGYPQKNGIIPNTKLCAEFYSRPINDFYSLQLSLWLPIPSRRDIMKKIYQGKTQKILIGTLNQEDSKRSLCVLTNLNPRSYSYHDYYSVIQYFKLYKLMTGKEIVNQSLYELIDIALDHWQERIKALVI